MKLSMIRITHEEMIKRVLVLENALAEQGYNAAETTTMCFDVFVRGIIKINLPETDFLQILEEYFEGAINAYYQDKQKEGE